VTPDELLGRLRLPLMAAPMSFASSLPLALAACRSGIMGCFPTHNPATLPINDPGSHGGVRQWIETLTNVTNSPLSDGSMPAPFAVNIAVTRRKDPALLAEEVAACREFQVPIVTTNVGDPAPIVEQVHNWGGLVIHDATTVAHAERAAAAGVDGMMLVCCGAGGLAGLLNPFAFVRRVRQFYDGLILLAGGIADGAGIAAAEMLGADMACMGTRFIATAESGVYDGHKQMLTEADIGDVVWTDAISGNDANFLRPSIVDHDLDIDMILNRPKTGRVPLPGDIRPWKDVWSGGHSVGLIDSCPPVSELVDRLSAEYHDARRGRPDRGLVGSSARNFS
jgi:nitronate monooxygenase